MPLPLLLASCVASPDDDLLVASAAIDFGASADGRLLANGKPFHLKGAVWFGAESQGAPLGLAERRAVDLFDFLSGNDFNAVKLLFGHPESVFHHALVEKLGVGWESSGIERTILEVRKSIQPTEFARAVGESQTCPLRAVQTD